MRADLDNELNKWLRAPYQVWRWRAVETDPDHYEAVETTGDGFRWFAWSHLHGDPHGQDGQTRVALQTYDEFCQNGPLREVPTALRGQLDDWVASLQAGYGRDTEGASAMVRGERDGEGRRR